jgi:hypothetical protein
MNNQVGGSFSDTIKKWKEDYNKFITSDLANFLRDYLWFIIYFFIIFYIILSINSTTKIKTVYLELKIFFYLTLGFLLLIINDILVTPYEKTKQFLIILTVSMIILYGSTYLIIYYYKGKARFWVGLSVAIGIAIFIMLVFYFLYYFGGNEKRKSDALNLFSSFRLAYLKNKSYLKFIVVILVIFKIIYTLFNWRINLTDILLPSVLGIILIFFLFSLIIFLGLKLKIIDSNQKLNSFISIGSICVFLLCIYIYFLLSSIKQVCLDPSYKPDNDNSKEIIILFIFVSLITVLWLDDTRNWHRNGSIMFIFATIVTFYVFVFYSMKHPDLGLVSFWLLVEWFILYSTRKNNSKTSIDFSFMDV